ncbi:hypothetical protein [Ferruginibacter sp. HRS2-29]|uniref:hypothetical protein n=1 Tax=Ferruginibacter sp. HRS2-29 TaxID=2487334 RepID=UPI0020CF10F1|nr:hypothetical protein [Ferruginibacter sp. HRS2-29]MCP9752196.1 hypothetical protein [Ferruginibacter sp. HRS2-29]
MKLFYSVLFLLSLLLVFAGCKKDGSRALIIPGTYTGMFKVVYPSQTQTGPVTVTFSAGNRYSSTFNPGGVPGGGSGTCSISLVQDSITFNETNYWTGNFDWNLVLTGKYSYSFDGTHLKIWADKNGVGYYEYDLLKQE